MEEVVLLQTKSVLIVFGLVAVFFVFLALLVMLVGLFFVRLSRQSASGGVYQAASDLDAGDEGYVTSEGGTHAFQAPGGGVDEEDERSARERRDYDEAQKVLDLQVRRATEAILRDRRATGAILSDRGGADMRGPGRVDLNDPGFWTDGAGVPHQAKAPGVKDE